MPFFQPKHVTIIKGITGQGPVQVYGQPLLEISGTCRQTLILAALGRFRAVPEPRICYDSAAGSALGNLPGGVPRIPVISVPGRGPYMRSRRRLLIGGAVVAVAVLLGSVVLLRKHAPPEPARLLPSADAFLYADARWLHRTGETLPAIERSAEYSRFISETGIDPEHDLEEAALALHYPAVGRNSSFSSEEIRFSTVLRGKLQMDKLGAYLSRVSPSHEEYRGVTIYSLSLENRTLRVAMLATDLVATSNVDDPSVIRGIIDRAKKLASPFGGPQLLRQYYPDIQLASMAWGIFRTDRMPDQQLSLGGPFIGGSVKPLAVVASVRYLGNWALHVQAFTHSESDAQQLSGEWNAMRNALTAGLVPTEDGSAASENENAAISKFLQSSKIEADGNKVTVKATIPSKLLRSVMGLTSGTLPVR